jgi:serine protease AprX
VTPDRKVRVQGTMAAPGSQIRSVYPKVVRADDAWRNGVTGQGVTVAVVDTGIADVPDLAGRIVQVQDGLGPPKPCKNLSGELNCDDAYGHGTFVAGIIAGNGAGSGGKWKGVAPGARVLSVKIAGANGAADVSNVLAAIQWVVSFKDTYGIRVLNLSLGTDSTQTYRTDPFNYAVERAWEAGIAVVVSAGNRGPDPWTISKPADDPWVITVGATDDRGTRTVSDDYLPEFSARGPTAANALPKPDVVAPGAHIISLRAPGSTVDNTYPMYVDGSYRRGSGTSMAAGVVSGAVALMLQANPHRHPEPGEVRAHRDRQGHRLRRRAGRRRRGGGRLPRLLLGPTRRGQPGTGPLQRLRHPGRQPRFGADPGRRPGRHRARVGPRRDPHRPAPAVEPGRVCQRELAAGRLVPVDLGGVPLLPPRLVRVGLAG